MGAMTDVAMKLRDNFDGRAAEADLSGTIQTENFEEMAAHGYLRGPAPTELGGLGADLVESSTAQRALGWGCGSTALTVNMHLFQVGAAADGFRALARTKQHCARSWKTRSSWDPPPLRPWWQANGTPPPGRLATAKTSC